MVFETSFPLIGGNWQPVEARVANGYHSRVEWARLNRNVQKLQNISDGHESEREIFWGLT